MTDHDDIDGLAAEFVLGTLDARERSAVAARRLREPALDASITAWERRLSPLNAAISEIAPPPHILTRIQDRLRKGANLASGTVVDLRRRLNFWRATALAATAAAAALLAVIGATQFAEPPKTRNLVAILQKDAASPAFLISVDVDNRLMTVRPVAAKHEAGKSYELWIIHDSLGKPNSLGVVDGARPANRPTLAAYQPDVIANSTYAISLEPEGGSPTGAPTGPVVFSGRMLEASEN